VLQIESIKLTVLSINDLSIEFFPVKKLLSDSCAILFRLSVIGGLFDLLPTDIQEDYPQQQLKIPKKKKRRYERPL
jgi:hypothetical protein